LQNRHRALQPVFQSLPRKFRRGSAFNPQLDGDCCRWPESGEWGGRPINRLL